MGTRQHEHICTSKHAGSPKPFPFTHSASTIVLLEKFDPTLAPMLRVGFCERTLFTSTNPLLSTQERATLCTNFTTGGLMGNSSLGCLLGLPAEILTPYILSPTAHPCEHRQHECLCMHRQHQVFAFFYSIAR